MIGTSYLDLTQVRLHFGHGGTPGSPSVLLLHGWPDLWFTWEAQMRRLLERGYYVVAPDQRGYGRSSKPPHVQDYDLDRLAQDIVELIDRLALAPVHLVGHDWGAAVAWWVAMARPELLRSLTIVNAPHPAVYLRNAVTNPVQLLRSSYMLPMQVPGLADTLLSLRDATLQTAILRFGGHIRDQALLARYREVWREPGAISYPLYWYRALVRGAAKREAKLLTRKVRVPTQVLWGRNDPAFAKVTPEQSLRFCEQGELHWFATGHWPYHEQPGPFSQQLLSFLDRHTPELQRPAEAAHDERQLH